MGSAACKQCCWSIGPCWCYASLAHSPSVCKRKTSTGSVLWLLLGDHCSASVAVVCPPPVYFTELLTVYKPTRQLRSSFSSNASILCLPSQCVLALAWSGIKKKKNWIMLHHLSGTVFLAKLDHQTDSRFFVFCFLHHLWNLTSSSCPVDSVSGWVGACARVCVLFAEVCFDCVLFFAL